MNKIINLIQPEEYETLIRKQLDKEGKCIIFGHCFGRVWGFVSQNWVPVGIRYYSGRGIIESGEYKGFRRTCVVSDVTEPGKIADIFRNPDTFNFYVRIPKPRWYEPEPIPQYMTIKWEETEHWEDIWENIRSIRLGVESRRELMFRNGSNHIPLFVRNC